MQLTPLCFRYCRTGAHLAHCADLHCTGRFKCPDSYCVPVSRLCDGENDCPEGEDEWGCVANTTMLCPGMYRCEEGTCIHQYQVCDGISDCVTGEDEFTCPTPECPHRCSCRHLYATCQLTKQRTLLAVREYKALQVYGIFKDFSQIYQCAQLILLNVSHGQVQAMGNPSFKLLSGLRYLDLSHNRLRVIQPYTFSRLTRLEHLWLHGNKINHIQHHGFSDVGLKTLDLSHLLLQYLDKEAFVGVNLSYLDLSYNYLTTFSMAYFSTDIASVNIENNPLKVFEISTDQFVVKLKQSHVYLCCLSPWISCDGDKGFASICPLSERGDEAATHVILVCGCLKLLIHIIACARMWLKLKGKGKVLIGQLWVLLTDSLTGLSLVLLGVKEIMFPFTQVATPGGRQHVWCQIVAGLQLSSLCMSSSASLAVSWDVYHSVQVGGGGRGRLFVSLIPVSMAISLVLGFAPVLLSHKFSGHPVDVTAVCSHFLPVYGLTALNIVIVIIITATVLMSVAEVHLSCQLRKKILNSAKGVKAFGGRIHNKADTTKKTNVTIRKKIILDVLSIMAKLSIVLLLSVTLVSSIESLDSSTVEVRSLAAKVVVMLIPSIPTTLNPLIMCCKLVTRCTRCNRD